MAEMRQDGEAIIQEGIEAYWTGSVPSFRRAAALASILHSTLHVRLNRAINVSESHQEHQLLTRVQDEEFVQ